MEVESIVKGYHEYKGVWTPVTGEEMTVIPEDDDHDRQVITFSFNTTTNNYFLPTHIIISSGVAIMISTYVQHVVRLW